MIPLKMDLIAKIEFSYSVLEYIGDMNKTFKPSPSQFQVFAEFAKFH